LARHVAGVSATSAQRDKTFMENTTADSRTVNNNVDQAELDKFSDLASRWWDPNSEFKPLHDINPLRLNYINEHATLDNAAVLDVGCGGGILSESMAQRGASVTGIDLAEAPLPVTKVYRLGKDVDVNYMVTAVRANEP